MIVKEEVNVKAMKFDKNISDELVYDTVITPELKAEGLIREITRAVQDLRQETKLSPKEGIVLVLDVPKEVARMLIGAEKVFSKEVGAVALEYGREKKLDAEAEIKTDEGILRIGIRRA